MNRCDNLPVILYSLVISFTVSEERLYMVLLKLTNVYLPLLCCFYVFSINDFKKKLVFIVKGLEKMHKILQEVVHLLYIGSFAKFCSPYGPI